MILRFRLFGVLGAFWLVYMIVIRLVFLMYNFDLSAGLSMREFGLVMWKGLRMDLSITGYYLMAYGLLLVFSAWFPGAWAGKTVRGCSLFFLAFSGIITVVDMELYRHWGFRLNDTPFMYLGSGSFGSISPWVAVKGVLVFFLLLFVFWSLFTRMTGKLTGRLSEAVPTGGSLAMLALTGLMILPVRGSLTVAPINAGFVYFHGSKPYANHAAINVIWNFMSSLKKSANVKYPEDFSDPDEAAGAMEALYPETDSTVKLLRVQKPNVLLIILESFTSGIIGPLEGADGVTPNLNALCREGILFTGVYASGDRTDKGLVSILSGYPAQTQTSIVKFPHKTEKLPSLCRKFGDMGYQTSFLYGGDANFASFRSYLTSTGFTEISDLDDFPDEQNTSKWGVHDQYLFERLGAGLDTAASPFFRAVLTLSSHEPFDVPMRSSFYGNEEESLYLNSCYYTDFYLGKFIEYAKSRPWWDSTLIVITADHGHRHPGNKSLQDEKRFRVPLLFLGGALAQGGLEVKTMGGQTDIANTLLAQIAAPDRDFRFSKDLLSPAAVPFAAFYFHNGYGFLQPGKQLVYDHVGKNFVVNSGGNDDRDIRLSKAYQQALFSDYNRR